MKNKAGLCKTLIENRKLLIDLAKNDFKKKFAGSYLGIVWAFIQPVITILVYWFVFQVGLNQKASDLRTGIEVPFVMWLMGGLVPWFFFQDAWNGGTNAFIEYDYLVKKVVFKIETLPMVKLVSAIYPHLFFLLVSVVLFACMGYFPSLYTLQIVYYLFAMMMLLLGLVYASSAIAVLFRDFKQVVNIVLQVGMWVTPIMWNIDDAAGVMNIPSWAVSILKLNPMYYIVNGYRDSMINKIGFWEHPLYTVVFWIITLLLLLWGTRVFKRLQVHFADVL